MSKPKPRVVYLIRDPANPKRFLHYVATKRREAKSFRAAYLPHSRTIVKFVEVCDG